jgi:glycine C-acetyltransferase
MASKELFDLGVFALPAVHPAVPKGQAVIRTAFMSTHQDHHISHVLEAVEKLADKMNIRVPDLLEEGALNESMIAAAAPFDSGVGMAKQAVGTGVD